MKLPLSLSTVLLIAFVLNTQAQNSKVLERYPNNAVKQEIITAADSSYMVLIDYYKNGKRQSVDTLVNDALVGWSTEYNEDGTIYVSQLFYYNTPLVQRFYLYYKDGVLKTEWISDTLKRDANPVDIEPANGTWKEYYHNGKLKMAGRKNENRNNDGEWIYYDDSGKEAKRVFYINGKKVE